MGEYSYGFENPVCVTLISNDERNRDGYQDASCATENIFLAAHSYGIGSVWLNTLMTLRKKEPVKSLLDEFNVPDTRVIWCMVVLGSPAEEGALLAKKKDVIYYIEYVGYLFVYFERFLYSTVFPFGQLKLCMSI